MDGSLTSDFANVKFLDIPEAFGVAEPVTFRYTIARSLVPSSSDWIGLFRVGWNSTKEYVTYEWTSLPENYNPGMQVECICTFKDNLPKNDEDFFQFCYISSTQNKVCGASSPFQFLEDYDIVVIDETESMLIVQSKPSLSRLPTITTDEQHRQPLMEELAMSRDEMDDITAELMETKKHLMEKDSQLKNLESEVNQLRSKLRENEDMSGTLAEDIDRLKSDLFDEKEKRISIETSFHEIEKYCLKASSEFEEKELAFQQNEMLLKVTVQDLQKQLCEKAEELESLNLEHSSTLSMLDVKQSTVEELNKRCSKMSTEITQAKRAREKVAKLEMIWKEKEAAYQTQIKRLQTASGGGRPAVEKRINQMVLENQVEFQRNAEKNDLTVTDGVESLAGATAEDGKIQNESSVDRVESSNSCSANQCDGKDGNDRIPTQKTCRVCNLTFPAGTSLQVIRDHLQSHQKICPMCDERFELNCTQPEFEMHVSKHLADTIKRPDGRRICPMCQQEFPPAFAQGQFEIHVNKHFVDTLRSS